MLARRLSLLLHTFTRSTLRRLQIQPLTQIACRATRWRRDQTHSPTRPSTTMAQPATTNANGATLEQLLACPGEYTRDAPLRLSAGGAGAAAPTLSLFDFNILARPYCDGVRRFRTHPTPELLAWNWRRARIHEMVATAQADVVCMQELVQAEFESAEQRAAQAAAQAAQAAKEAQAAQAAAQRKADMARKAAAKAARAQARQANGASSNGSAAADDAGAAASSATPAAAEPAPAAAAAPAASPSPSPSAVAAAPADASAPASAAPAASAATSDESAAAAATAENDDDLREDDGDDEVSSTASVNYVPPVEGDFSTFLTSQGYAYRLQTPAARADKYPVGTGIFWRLSRFYETPVVVDSRSRALIVALKLRPLRPDAPEPPASLDNVVFVCNVHLQGHHSETATRLNQVKSLFKQLEKHVASVARGVNGSGGAAAAAPKQKDKTKVKAAAAAPAEAAAALSSDEAASATAAAAAPASPPATAPMLLLTGDFNQTHTHSAVHRLAVAGHVPAGFCDERLRHHPDLFAQRGIVTPVEVSQPFPLESVYDRERRAASLFPRYTYHNNHYVGSPYNDVLDYIYHTAATLPLLASMRVVDGEEAVRIEETSLPNELIPSDHLPIGATFFVPSLAAARQDTQEKQDDAEQKR